MKDNKWLRLLAYVTGMVNQRLLLQNEYLAAENRILRAHLPKRLRLHCATGNNVSQSFFMAFPATQTLRQRQIRFP